VAVHVKVKVAVEDPGFQLVSLAVVLGYLVHTSFDVSDGLGGKGYLRIAHLEIVFKV
jgi:hypothetical protein